MRKKTPEFEALQEEWYRTLRDEGFKDIEHRNTYLKAKDTRTQTFRNRDRIEDFFLDLDLYLEENGHLSDRDWLILTLYSEGKYIKQICQMIRYSRQTVHKVIRKYKKSLF